MDRVLGKARNGMRIGARDPVAEMQREHGAQIRRGEKEAERDRYRHKANECERLAQERLEGKDGASPGALRFAKSQLENARRYREKADEACKSVATIPKLPRASRRALAREVAKVSRRAS